MSIFVTVGSTSFDDLIKILSSDECINLLQSNGFRKITFQIGRGDFIPPQSSKLDVQWFRFEDSLSEYIKNASLVIGHAGAGTILESLFERKQLIVVLNEHLMNNHQVEIAEKLASEGYLICSSCSRLLDIVRDAVKDDFVKASFKPERDVFMEVLEHLLCLK